MWKGKWIWIDEEKNPHNKFVWFKKYFYLGEFDYAQIKITAETRYELYINERFIGKGPARSWDFEYSYDTYDLTSYLKKGKNLLSILVHHFGISTFQSIEGSAGLLCEIEVRNKKKKSVIASDSTWKCAEDIRFERYAPRLTSCQLAFCEIYDAKKELKKFKNAVIVDTVKENKLIKNDIPFLTFEEIYPKRIYSIRSVKKPKNTISFDMRPIFFPQDFSQNLKFIQGLLCLKIISEKENKGKIIIWWYKGKNKFKLNGKEINIDQEVLLNKGENLFLMDLTTPPGEPTHTYTTFINFDFKYPVAIKAINYPESPLELFNFNTSFKTWGGLIRKEFEKNPILEEIWQNANMGTIKKYKIFSKPIKYPFFSLENLNLETYFSEERAKIQIDENYNNIIYPNQEFAEIKNKNADTEIIIDFEQEFSGYIEFDIDAKEDNILDFDVFEYVEEQTKKRVDNIGINNSLKYKCKNGRQDFRSFVRRGGRYLNLTVRGKSSIKIYSIKILNSSYPVSNRTIFRTNDHTLMKIFEMSRNTAKCCMEDTYVDCPTREQTFWVGDARNESLINFYTFGAYNLTKRCLRLAAKSLNRSPLIESQVPSGYQDILTAWAIFWIYACKEYYEFTGDEKFLKEIYPYLLKNIKGFGKFINKNNLLEINTWNMFDWAEMDTPTFGIVTHQNAFLVKALSDSIYLAEVLKKEQDKKYFQELRKKLKESINKTLYCQEKGAYYDSIHEDGKPSNVFSIQTQIAVFLSEVATEETKNRLTDLILNPPKNFVQIGSPFASFFYLEALVKMGEFQKMLDYIRENWGARMIDKGAVTCWEVFDNPGGSNCHAWSAAPAYFLPAYILGIRPAQPGFKKIIIDPQPGDLKWAKGAVPTPRGDIYIEWQKNEDGTVSIKTEPANLSQ